MTTTEFLAAVAARREVQDRKWGVGTQRDCDRFLAILLEEVGEVAKELNEGRDPGCLVEELVDVAAVCAKWAEWGLPAAGDRSGVAQAAVTSDEPDQSSRPRQWGYSRKPAEEAR